jgi:ABC-type multidrug transport system fused ATPase/permease subunit
VEDLRSRITFISKDGWLLSGTIRSNLDPFGEYDDYALWQVLYRVRLAKPSIHDLSPSAGDAAGCYVPNFSAIQDLDKDLGKEGCRLPVYQRQLLCIARALLQDCTKLVIIEEAHLAPEAQEIVRSVIDQEFEESVNLLLQTVYY